MVFSGDSDYVCLLFPGSPLASIPRQHAADPFPPQQRSLAALRIISRWAFWCWVLIYLAELSAVHPTIPTAGGSVGPSVLERVL